MASDQKAPDPWVLARDEAKRTLLACQAKHRVDSCMKCEKVIGCEVRNEYVKKVYESMSKGKGGGFEF